MTSPPHWSIERHGRVGSTMDLAAERALAGAPEGTVVVADEQTAGRGRLARTWRAPPGVALLMTALLRPPLPADRLSTLPLVAAVAAARAIEGETGLPVWLKWPNDLWLGERHAGRKVGGILLSARLGPRRPEHVLLGIGLNVSTAASDLPDGATSLAIAAAKAEHPTPESGDDPRTALLDRLLACLAEGYGVFLGCDGRPPLAPWLDRAALLNETVEVEVAGATKGGVFVGLREDGALLLRGDGGDVEAIVAGDLIRGPRQPERPVGPGVDRRRGET